MLESIAGLLPGLPDESVEGLLVTFDSLTANSEESLRPAAAQLLRRAAESCQDPARHNRLLRAATAVAAGEPCALTPDGLTWKQAAAAQTVTQAEWEARAATTPEPPLPGSASSAGEDDDQVEEPEESPYMEQEPPKLPHLSVRHFFPGLVARVAHDFADAEGQAVCTGDLLTVMVNEATDGGYVLTFLERTVYLSDRVAGHDAIIGNAGNAWFQPVPSAACLEELLEAIDLRFGEIEEDEDDESDDDLAMERIEALRRDVEECQRWLSRTGGLGPAPRCQSGRLAAKVFGQDHHLTAWLPLLFAAVSVCMADS